MCDRENLAEWAQSGNSDWSVNRRQFSAMAAMGALSACATTRAAEPPLAEDMVSVTTPDGQMDAFYVRPASGKHPAILTWPDIAGLREAFKVMARRLAGQGYAVLVANHYYRSGKAPLFKDFPDFQANDGFAKAGEMRKKMGPDAIMRDASAAIAWLDARDEVDTSRGVGTNGYCMGGPFTVFTAAAVPGRVRAAASLHGAGLVKDDDPQSPHKLLDRTKAGYLFAIAQNDDEKDPKAKTELRAATKAAGRPAEIEVYPANHGWTVIDSPSYDQVAAERAWTRMSALFETLS
ncbi:dienelactone hydrolase family protein [Stakelama marina]|uniref:Dienelactone hydrolase family protein n=1 Tax=Stakelama marina TaxID=2826939 RepID=A0A8T4IFJ6_9SPHN|nr:dienelactone hydrolase family protein [Stakelama marina]MBR0551029.1 dienelactone hydrolase family protein [Stakelama marina]